MVELQVCDKVLINETRSLSGPTETVRRISKFKRPLDFSGVCELLSTATANQTTSVPIKPQRACEDSQLAIPIKTADSLSTHSITTSR